MIITRTPLRISLGGGGTDLPAFYRRYGGGFLVAAAISKYVYIAVNRNFDDDLLLKYSQVERVPSPAEVRHPILREALLLGGITGGIEISSMADIPAGTGLGSSGAFSVGVLKALGSYQRRPLTNQQVAELACHIEIDRLAEPVGKQDQYIAAIGGLTSFEFRPDDTVDFAPVAMSEEARLGFEENLLLFYTGVRRSASEEIKGQMSEATTSPDELAANLSDVRAIGRESQKALEQPDLAAFACLMTEQWRLKCRRAPTPVHQQFDGWIRQGIKAGATGGKLVGAGGGGFLLFYAEDKVELRSVMSSLGLEEVRFAFDHEGTKVIVS
jgi:D-glycero-alpha-D-manno-heptose-7-phosphate kinase